MKKKIFYIILILVLSACSNLKNLNAFDGYRGKPHIVEYESYRVTEENSKNSGFKIITYYDKTGRRIRHEDLKLNGSPSTGGTYYKYDRHGNLPEISMYHMEGSINVQNRFKYNEYGQQTVHLYTNQRDTVTTVSNFDRKSRTEEIRGWYRDGSFKEYAIQKYDKYWRALELVSFDSLGRQKNRIRFEHDKNGNQIASRWFNSQDDLTAIYKTRFNSHQDPVHSLKYSVQQGDTIKIREERNEYDYDIHGNITENRLYNTDRLVWIKKYTYTY